MRRLRFRWAGRMAILLLAGVCIAEDLLQQEVISREVGLFVGQSPQPPPPVLERVAVTNGGFESVPIVQNLLYWTNRAGWTGSGNPSFGGPLTYGRGNNGGLPAPSEGEQAVGLQKDAVIFTPLTVPHPGAYFLSWRHASRAGQVNPYIVFTNRVSGTSGTAVGPRVPVSPVFNTSSTEWSTVTLQMWFNQAGTVLLGFAGLNSGGGDETVVIDDVQLMRFVSEGTRTFPEMREVVSREASFYIEGNRGRLLEEVVSREVSFTVDAVGTPPPVLDLALTVSPTGETVTVDWSRFYNPWSVKDVAAFHVYQSATPFDSVAGRTPTRVVPADTLSTTFTGLPAWRDSYYAVVAVDALGNAGTEVVCSGAYVLMPELVSREASFFVGNGPDREAISRETSLLIDNPGSPVAVGRFLVMPSANGDSVTLDWSSYNSWQEKDVVHYRVYYSDRLISSLEGVPWVQVPGETFRWTFNGLTPWTDHFFAVIPVDGLGNSAPGFHYQGAYVLMPEVVSREAGVFVGDEPVPPYREVISREASLVVADAVVPAPVTGITSGFLAGTSRSRYGAIDLDWTAYAEEEQRDIVRYRLYSSDRFFTNVTEMAWTAFPENPDRWDGRRRATIQGLDPAQIHYVAVVAEDAAGRFNPSVYSVSALASIGTVGEVRNLVATPTRDGWEIRWEIGGTGDNLEGFLRGFRVYRNGTHLPLLLGPLARSSSLPAMLEAGGTTVKVTTVDVFGVESPGATLELRAPQPFVGTNAWIDELTQHSQDLLLRDGTFPVGGLTVTLLSGPVGLVVTNGVLAWTPTEAQGPSTNEVVVSVTDGVVAVTNRFVITVREVNSLPRFVDVPGAQVSGTYDASLGTLPQAQGWRPAAGPWGGGAPNDYVSNGTLYMNPSPAWNGYGQAYADSTYPPLSQPIDLANGFTNTFTVKVVEGRFTTMIADKFGISSWLDVDASGYLQFRSGPSVAFDPSDALHTYVITGNANSVELRIDGAENPILVAPTHSTSDLNYILFGDVIHASYTVAQLTKFSFQVNSLLMLPGPTNATINELVGYTQALTPQDADLPAQTLTVSLVSGPTGLVVTNGVLAWTPMEMQGPSTNTVEVEVSDGVDSVTNRFEITVREVNVSPRWLAIPDGVGEVGKEYVQRLEVVDEDLPVQPLTFQLLEPIPGAVVESGLFRWTPTSTQAGSTNRIRVVASDGVASVENEFRIRVIGALTPPTFVGGPELAGDRLRLRVRVEGVLRLEVSEDLINWRHHSTVEGTEGSVVTTEIPLELGSKFFRLIRVP